jgi:hypothetical protein
MLRTALLLSTVATVAHAQPAPKPTAILDAEVTAISAPLDILCGVLMATQTVTLRVTKVDRGPQSAGNRLNVRVMTCFGGPLLRPIPKGSSFELDPAKIRPGSRVHAEIEEIAKGAWFTTTDKVTVTKR